MPGRSQKFSSFVQVSISEVVTENYIVAKHLHVRNLGYNLSI